MVGIVDYQAGNTHSLQSAFEHVGANVKRIISNDQIDGCTHIVLPGVGAFGFCAKRLSASGLIDDLKKWALVDERPLLGICVGMQLFADSSAESTDAPGLGWVGGDITQLQSSDTVRVPHVGWNEVEFQTSFGSFGAGDKADFYFDHSYALGLPRKGAVLANCLHGSTFTSAVQFGSVTAVQFHPEKSQTAGLNLLEGFLQR